MVTSVIIYGGMRSRCGELVAAHTRRSAFTLAPARQHLGADCALPHRSWAHASSTTTITITKSHLHVVGLREHLAEQLAIKDEHVLVQVGLHILFRDAP